MHICFRLGALLGSRALLQHEQQSLCPITGVNEQLRGGGIKQRVKPWDNALQKWLPERGAQGT
ncbi:hypothetical protein EDI28_06990 [Photobacterium chitinilyticum]|uniref:Uncharacterized protein n=1 Tax=Photobacterium chitinilyticum TaxID=2485123 RepID=A0A3S3UKF9_9GAMM|nr:hypothetical protein EDI28_06990 [Photobacterium chitinilyticum]